MDKPGPGAPGERLPQSGVLPFFHARDGLRLLMITNRRGRWILPKGLVEPGLTRVTSAAKEAWEEAGIRGIINNQPLGTYHDFKWGRLCDICIFPMEVTSMHSCWPEMWRKRRWVKLHEFHRLLDPRIPFGLAMRLAKLPELWSLSEVYGDPW